MENYILKEIQTFVKPRLTFHIYRHKLMRYQLEASKSTHAFLKRFQKQIKLFEYHHEFEKTMLVDQINAKSPIKRRNLTIMSALKVAETNKTTTRQLKAICIPIETMTMQAVINKSARKCRYCSTDHEVRQCSAKDKECMKSKILATSYMHAFQVKKE